MADRLAMLVMQRAAVTFGDKLVGKSRQASNAIVRQRAIVILCGGRAGRQAGNVSQAESNSHLKWQTGRQTS